MKKCVACNSTRVSKFIEKGKLIIACKKCGFRNERSLQNDMSN